MKAQAAGRAGQAAQGACGSAAPATRASKPHMPHNLPPDSHLQALGQDALGVGQLLQLLEPLGRVAVVNLHQLQNVGRDWDDRERVGWLGWEHQAWGAGSAPGIARTRRSSLGAAAGTDWCQIVTQGKRAHLGVVAHRAF